ncbi:MAG: hypothetical protein OIF55_17680 [Amphritea sp.]|nr:hypothetical protein [Amphritea sp.]
MVLDTPLLVKLIFFSTLALLLPTATMAGLSRRRSSLFWACGLALGALGCWFILQTGSLSILVTVVLSMGLMSVSLFLFLSAIRKLSGHSCSLWYLVLPASLMVLSQWSLSENYQYRSILNSLILGVQFLLLVAAILTDRRSPLCMLRMMLIFAALIPGVVYLLRAVVYLMTSDMPYFALGNSPLQIIALLSVLGFLPLATCAVLLIQQPENRTESGI